jgi:hypothetical protein
MLTFAANPARFRNLADIYYVTANTTPDKPVSLDRELGKIMNRIGSWGVRPRPAAKISEIVTDLMDYDPDIVHFGGHGTETERLELFDELEEPKDESRKKIDELFRKMKGKIRLVVLNACYSKTVQADRPEYRLRAGSAAHAADRSCHPLLGDVLREPCAWEFGPVLVRHGDDRGGRCRAG